MQTVNTQMKCFDPGLVPYFQGDWSWNNFYHDTPPSTDSKSVVFSNKWKYVHEALVEHLIKLTPPPKKKKTTSVVRWTDRPNMTIAADWDIKPHHSKQT